MSSSHSDNRNPTGIELTQEQRDESFRTGYRHNLPLLWAEFKKRNAAAGRPEFDRIK